jgi:hypothetical protein
MTLAPHETGDCTNGILEIQNESLNGITHLIEQAQAYQDPDYSVYSQSGYLRHARLNNEVAHCSHTLCLSTVANSLTCCDNSQPFYRKFILTAAISNPRNPNLEVVNPIYEMAWKMNGGEAGPESPEHVGGAFDILRYADVWLDRS